jgi:hypothetical protein
MRHLVLAVIGLLAFAPIASATQIDDAVQALGTSPVYVAPGAKPALSTVDQRRIRDAIAAADAGPVYVADLPASALDEAGGDPGELVRRIGEGLHQPGTYAVVAGGHFRAASTELARGEAAKLATEAFDAHRAQGLGATLVDFVRRVGAVRAGGGSSSGGGGSSTGGGGLLAFLALIAGGGGLIAFMRSRRRRREQRAQVQELKRIADGDLVALGDDVRAIDIDIEMPGVDPRARDDLGIALDRYERAEQAIARARTPRDFAPVSQALEESRFAMESAKARLAGKPPPERRPPCFFDPRHGPSTRDVMWSPGGYESPRPVPACEADALRVESGDEPMTREVMLGGRRVPYYFGPTWMGPYAGGWFGGFGGLGGGFLGGLLLGEMMGGGFGGWGGWGGGYGGGDPGMGDGGGFGDFGGGFGGGDFGGGDFGGGGGGDF